MLIISESTYWLLLNFLLTYVLNMYFDMLLFNSGKKKWPFRRVKRLSVTYVQGALKIPDYFEGL